ncbi:unnamed protein product [Mytilus coruscus]|uniref:Tyr recombinase domain-containing protein n=1 Tax=Mytilus coruscus TaxID=42192 RepID=A0A6J8D5Q5_MYTCO|nr:unnamed protein product [Mytilus coruscus]
MKNSRYRGRAGYRNQRGRRYLREVSSLIGLFTSASCAVLLAPIFHRYLDIEKTLALSNNNDNYDGIMSLSENSKNEILWWIKNVARNEGKSISFGTPTENFISIGNFKSQDVNFKIATLLALTTAQRAQTLTKLNLNYMDTSSKTVVFTMNCLQKTDRTGRINQNITLDAYKKKELCPVYTLKYYLKATKKLRKDDYLLVSFRTWRKISTSTLARWLKIVLTSSGIDLTKFQAHSFRGASTSAAFSAGITLDTIMKTANWKSAKTFKKFYLREVEAKGGVKTCKKKFINAVLSV